MTSGGQLCRPEECDRWGIQCVREPVELRTTATHVDDWLDEPPVDEAERKAKEWLERFRSTYPDGLSIKEMSAWLQEKDAWLAQHSLFCTYKGRTYRVVGASRLGDVWLNRNFDKRTGYSSGYEHRVDVTECSNWERR
jgi:hypothetical protein